MVLIDSGVGRVVDRGFAEAIPPCADPGPALLCIRLTFALHDLLTI